MAALLKRLREVVATTHTPSLGDTNVEEDFVEVDLGNPNTSADPEISRGIDYIGKSVSYKRRLCWPRYKRSVSTAIVFGAAALVLVICSVALLVIPWENEAQSHPVEKAPDDDLNFPATLSPQPSEETPDNSTIDASDELPESTMPPDQDQVSVFTASRKDDVVNYLVDQELSSTQDLSKIGSPQALAALWLSYQDSRQLPVPTTSFNRTVADEAYHFTARYVLAVLYFSTNGNTWLSNAGFLDGSHVCEWSRQMLLGDIGVACTGETDAVPTEIKLGFNKLSGRIPTELATLWSLRSINLEGNTLSGSIPEGIDEMPFLESIVLGHNRFEGSIPAELGRSGQLRTLVLSNNHLSGTVPSSLSLSKAMEILSLDRNELQGTIGGFIKPWMVNLTYVFLESNQFEGSIPVHFLPPHSNLIMMDVSNNRLGGNPPESLFQQHNLRILDMHNNTFSGALPEFVTTSPMEFLSVSGNQLDGTIPESIGYLTNLKHLDMSRNYFFGAIPVTLELLSRLTYLFVSNNNFSRGPVPDLASMTNLRQLSLKSTSRTGQVPSALTHLTRLNLLDLEENSLTGTLPSSLSSLRSMNSLMLGQNEFTGPIPPEIASLEMLRLLTIDRNSLTGSLGDLCSLPQFSKNSRDFPVIADCTEVDCPCCTLCCVDLEPDCHNETYRGVMDPTWGSHYVRPNSLG